MRACLAFLVVTGLWLLAAIPTSAEESKREAVQAELSKWQGLWQTSPGGIEHRDGNQVVRNPEPDGPCFFVHGDRLIWLDALGAPTGREGIIQLDPTVQPKRVTLVAHGDKSGDGPSHGIYTMHGGILTVHFGVDGGPAPKQFLELNKPIKGMDGAEWLVQRKKLQDK